MKKKVKKIEKGATVKGTPVQRIKQEYFVYNEKGMQNSSSGSIKLAADSVA